MKIVSFILILSLVVLTKAFGLNNPPVAVNDTVYGFIGYPVQVHLLRNDYDPDGDSIYVYYKPANSTKINDSTWEILIAGSINGYETSIITGYIIKDENGGGATAKVVIILKAPLRYDSLDINNINALLSPVGQHFWDFETAHFEVPKGSGKMAVFSNQFWVGGIDPVGQIHFAGEKYRQVGKDFMQGPISSVRDSSFDKIWNGVWKLDKQQILYHLANYSNAGYQPIEAIKTWPAHGDVTLGQMADIAPFYDTNLDGIYDPYAGDYPLIRGDQAIFFVFNDAACIHTESQSEPLGVEIHGMAYEFDRPDDSLLNNTLFLHYDIINRSSVEYHGAMIGLFTDFDLGFAQDDYIACDVLNGMAYGYNGTAVDGTGQPWSYGEHPPAIGLKVIGGPLLPEDGIDNPAGLCDFSINGLNFGDNVIDNERFGMSYFNNYSNPAGQGSLDNSTGYYVMRNMWPDGTHIIFGGNGYLAVGGVGPECSFMFPGNTDTLCNWGTLGVPPNGGYNQNGKFWTESQAGNAPGDRRGVTSVGPFTMNAGQTVPFDYCFTFARDYTGDNLSSVHLLQDRVSIIPSLAGNLISLPQKYTLAIDDQPASNRLSIRPNPAKEWITIVTNEKSAQPFSVFDMNGKTIMEGILLEGNTQLDIKQLKPGVYVLKSGSRWSRFIKM